MGFEVSFYSLLFFGACLVYLYWGIYIIRLSPKESVNQAFFALILAVFTWSLGYAISNSSLNIESAIFWRKLATFGRIYLFGIILHFMVILTHTKEEMNNRWFLLLLYIPALVFSYVFVFSNTLSPLQYNLIRFEYGWVNKPISNIWNYLYYFYLVSYTLTSLLVVSKWKRRLKTEVITKQANLISMTIGAALLLGGLLDVIPSEILQRPFIQMSSVFILLPVWAMYYSARYYDVFTVEMMEKEEVFVTDSEQKKIFLNMAIGIFVSGIIGSVSEYFILLREGSSDLISSLAIGAPLLVTGIILGSIQKIKKDPLRETLNIIVLITSIPVVALLFLKYAAVTAWVLPIIIILSSLLFSNRTLLIATTIVGIGTQRLIWVLKPSEYVLVNEFDYLARMVIILAAFLIGLYINKIYIAKIKENNYQIEFQKMVSELSFDFVTLNQDNFDDKINNLLMRIGGFFNVDRTYLFRVDHNKKTMTYSNEWTKEGVGKEVRTIEDIPLEVFPWWIDQLTNNFLVYIEDVDLMPQEAKTEQDQLYRQDVKSLISVPIMGEGQMQAFIGIDSVLSKKKWSEENIDLLNIMANILSSGLTQINADRKIEFMAYYDNLTKLPNRFLFDDRVHQAINLSKRTGKFISVIFIDLDNFKSVNDTIGHKGGDYLLTQVANSLKGLVRKSDTVARFGGDEFLIMLNNISDYSMITKVADKIMEIFTETFVVNNQEFSITASAGIAVYPVDGEDSESLVKNADIAMYKAKGKGKNQYALCTIDMKEEVQANMVLSNDLYRAIDRDELKVYYQPQIDLETKKITGIEALVRWIHPTRGMISPAIFIPIAEKNSLINSIGEWVFKTACSQNKKWQDMGLPPLNIAVNLSAIQIINPNLPSNLEGIIKEVGLDPKYIELEITESIAIEETKYVIGVLNKFKKIGVSLAIDDFGTEYSSLSRLKLLPIDLIKIDMQFIQGIETNEKDKAITMVIINLAKSLGMNVLAEGVETKGQVDFLYEKNCDKVQGYFYYKPMPAEEMEKILVDLFREEKSERRVLAWN